MPLNLIYNSYNAFNSAKSLTSSNCSGPVELVRRKDGSQKFIFVSPWPSLDPKVIKKLTHKVSHLQSGWRSVSSSAEFPSAAQAYGPCRMTGFPGHLLRRKLVVHPRSHRHSRGHVRSFLMLNREGDGCWNFEKIREHLISRRYRRQGDGEGKGFSNADMAVMKWWSTSWTIINRMPSPDLILWDSDIISCLVYFSLHTSQRIERAHKLSHFLLIYLCSTDFLVF